MSSPALPAQTDAETPVEPFPPPPFTTPCDWAKDGFSRAAQAMGPVSTGVGEYHIGTRGLKYLLASQQIGTLGWWNELVKFFCGYSMLPDALVGRDTAFRVIPRDV
jgi:hypothetical protein